MPSPEPAGYERGLPEPAGSMMPPPAVRARWWNSTVIGIGVASLASDLSHETVTALLPSLLASMGAAAAVLGMIEGVADGLSTLAKLCGGWWTDRLERRKPLCAGGYAVMAAATGWIAAASSWPMVLAGRAAAWLARGLRTPARKALLAEAVVPACYGRAFGFERAMDTLGAVLAPLVVLVLLGAGFTARGLLAVATAPALAAAGAIVLLVRETPRRRSRAPALLASFGALPRRFRNFLGAVAVFGAGDFAHSLMILYAASALTPAMGAGRAAATAVGLYALHNVFYAGISYPAGILADRHDKRMLLAAGYGLGAVTAVLLACGVRGVPLLALAFACGGAYVGIEETLEDSLSAELLPSEVRGSGFGVLAAVNGAGDLVSSAVVGWLWSGFGPAAGFGFAALLMAAGTAVLAFSRRERADSPPVNCER